VELGVGRGRQTRDKRQELKKRQAQREIERQMRRRR
jgi:tmRNA-binding protein